MTKSFKIGNKTVELSEISSQFTHFSPSVNETANTESHLK